VKLALDNHVSLKCALKLSFVGHEIVYHARDEHDELWLSRALSAGAQVFVSADWDVDIFCNKVSAKCILLKQGLKCSDQYELLVRELKIYKKELKAKRKAKENLNDRAQT
jgi:hypothetical protein